MDENLQRALEILAGNRTKSKKINYLAQLLAISPSAIYHWYAGRTVPKLKIIALIEKLSGVSLETMYPYAHMSDKTIKVDLLQKLETQLSMMTENEREILSSILDMLDGEYDLKLIKRIFENIKKWRENIDLQPSQ